MPSGFLPLLREVEEKGRGEEALKSSPRVCGARNRRFRMLSIEHLLSLLRYRGCRSENGAERKN